MNFFESYHCTSRLHCKSCRNIDSDAFRSSLYEKFDDINEVNFECPNNVPWGVVRNFARKQSEPPQNYFDIDKILKYRDRFLVIDGVKKLFNTYNKRVEAAKCSACFKGKITRGINKCIVNFINEHKNTDILEGLDETLVLFDGITNKTIADWRKNI